MPHSSPFPWLSHCQIFWPMTSFHSSFIYISAVPHLGKELLNFISQEIKWLPPGPLNSQDIKDVSVILLVSMFFPNSAFLWCKWDMLWNHRSF